MPRLPADLPPGARDRAVRRYPAEAVRTGQFPTLAPGREARVTVVGGGLAGVAAAVVLAERGVRVTLREAAGVLGGRLSGWPDRLSAAAGGGAFSMERGFHAFFRQYYNVRSLLRRIDPQLSLLMPLVDYPLLGPGGAQESFARLPLRPPLNLAALVRRTSTLGVRDLIRMDGEVASEMLSFDADRTYDRFDHLSAAEYLDRVNFPPDARRMLFEVFAHSFFNPEERMSAGEMLMMFHLYFLGTAEGIVFDVLRDPFDRAVWAPIGAVLSRLGVDVRLNDPVTGLDEPGPDEGVVLAADVAGLRGVVEATPWLGGEGWRAAVAGLPQAPPFAVWRGWLDRRVRADRAAFAGTAGLGIIDNVSVLERYQREAAVWAGAHGGSVVELHAYAVPGGCGPERARQELLAALHALYPETAAATVLDERFLWRDDCPGFPPGAHAGRPTTATAHPRVVVAGDLVRLPFPTALMERAVASGFLAANHLLAGWGVTGEPVWSIRPRGLLAGMTAWKERVRERGRRA